MQLKDFVSETLREIIEGVDEAKTKCKDADTDIAPQTDVKEVQFDVAVTTGEGSATRGGIGVFSGMVALGSQGKSENSSSTVSRIRFSVPVRF